MVGRHLKHIYNGLWAPDKSVSIKCTEACSKEYGMRFIISYESSTKIHVQIKIVYMLIMQINLLTPPTHTKKNI